MNAVSENGVKNKSSSSISPNQKGKDPTKILPTMRGLKLACLNINKLTTHIDELRIFLANNDLDVLAINETKLDENIKDDEVRIPGYEI